jgi:GcrA cell cycle regulator
MSVEGKWTDERVELLKKLWSDGLPVSQIAAELGGINRNAVIGKVHRLGLSRPRAHEATHAAVARNAGIDKVRRLKAVQPRA